LDLGKHAEAAETVTVLPALLPAGGLEHRLAVGVLLRCLELARKDGAIPKQERAHAVAGYADQAMDLLRQAVANGYRDVETLKNAPSLAPLRTRQDFQQLLAEMVKKAA
jgi:hypothetical protein